MDSVRFDCLARYFAAPASRRHALRGLVALVPLGAAVAVGSPVGARKKKKIVICQGGQTLTVKKRKWAKKHPGATAGACATPPPVTCPALGQACQAEHIGQPCCSTVNPNVICQGFGGITCQDCSLPPAAPNDFCASPPKVQCCGNSPFCVAAVKADGTPVCIAPEFLLQTCTSDAQCTDGIHTICIKNGSCGGSTPNICARPCPSSLPG